MTATLTYATGGAIDLTTATIALVMKRESDGLRKVFAADIVSAAAGTVKYEWAIDDTKDVGEYQSEWQVTYASGKKITVPNTGYFYIEILSGL